MDGTSAARTSSTPSPTPSAQKAPAAPAPNQVVGKPFAGVLAAHLKATTSGFATKLAASRGAPSFAPRRAAAPSTATTTTKGKPTMEEDDGSADADARGSRGEFQHAKADDKAHDARDLDLLDPAARQAALLAPPLIQTATPAHAPAPTPESPLRGRTMEELLPALVKRIAWAGDRNRGTVHLELGAGAYAGTKITVHADAGKVRVELNGQEGPDLDRLRSRLGERLRGHGLDVESVM